MSFDIAIDRMRKQIASLEEENKKLQDALEIGKGHIKKLREALEIFVGSEYGEIAQEALDDK